MDIQSIKSQISFEVEAQKKESLLAEMKLKFSDNLKKVQHEAQVKAIEMYIELAQYDSKFLTVALKKSGSELIFLDDIDSFVKSDELVEMMKKLSDSGFKVSMQKVDDGMGISSWHKMVLTLDE